MKYADFYNHEGSYISSMSLDVDYICEASLEMAERVVGNNKDEYEYLEVPYRQHQVCQDCVVCQMIKWAAFYGYIKIVEEKNENYNPCKPTQD